jgi:RNA polymerase sigma-B factor
MSTRDAMPAPAATGRDDLDAAAAVYIGDLSVAAEPQRAALRAEFTRRCLPFAHRMARRYRDRGESAEDIEQVARLGLIKAIDRYDPGAGSFTAFAVITISGEIKRHFRDKTWGVHVPRRVQELTLEVWHTQMELTGALSRTPTPAEIAEQLHISADAVCAAVESAAAYSPASLNAPTADERTELGDTLGDLDADLEMVNDRLTVTELLLRVPPRDRKMLALRFYGNRTQAEIAAELGISQMQVSRLLIRALAWLREAMLSDVVPPWPGPDGGQRHTVELTVSRDDRALVVHLCGEVDRDSVHRLRSELRRAISTPGVGNVVIDLRRVPLVDAAGVALLLDAAAAASIAQVGLTLTGAQPYVAQTLQVSSLANLLTRGGPKTAQGGRRRPIRQRRPSPHIDGQVSRRLR